MDRLGQRLLALGVEVGVRLVQHHQERIAIERPGKRNALALPGRQRRAALADLGLVAVRQAQDQLVHAGRLAAAMTSSAGRVRIEARDVLGDRAGEQLDVLRQVADVLARGLGDPTGRAPRRRGEPCRAPAARRRPAARTSDDLPEALGPMTPSACAGLEREADVLHDELLLARAARR